MQDKIVCVVKDDKSGSFGSPITVSSIPELVRTMTMSLRTQKDSLLTQFPGDYSVWRVGKWSQDTGMFSELNDREFLFNVASLKGNDNGSEQA